MSCARVYEATLRQALMAHIKLAVIELPFLWQSCYRVPHETDDLPSWYLDLYTEAKYQYKPPLNVPLSATAIDVMEVLQKLRLPPVLVLLSCES